MKIEIHRIEVSKQCNFIISLGKITTYNLSQLPINYS